jgi:hydroxymethylglutaryl-CoA lyase
MTSRSIPRPPAVTIVDVCPRDGLQNDPVILPTETKVELVRRLAEAGLTRIEAASFVNPKSVPQMADAEAVLAAVVDLPGVSVSGLVLNERGFDRALAAGLHEISFVAVATDTMAQRNQASTRAGLVSQWASIAEGAKAAGMLRSVTIAVAFGCPFEGEVPPGRVVALAGDLAAIGLDELSLADTIGVAGPRQVEELFLAVAAAMPGIPLRAHLHNTRNTGYANADAAIRAGVSVLDSSLGGLGGCPFAPGATGNIATEDLAYMLDRDRIATGLSLSKLRDATLWLEGVMGRRLPAHTAHVGPFPPLARAG